MAKLVVRVRAFEGQGPEHSRDIDAAGVPAVDEVLGIEVDGTMHDFKVVSRRFDFGAAGTTVIVEADDLGNLAPPMVG